MVQSPMQQLEKGGSTTKGKKIVSKKKLSAIWSGDRKRSSLVESGKIKQKDLIQFTQKQLLKSTLTMQ